MSIESRSRQYGKVFDHWQIREYLGSGSGGKSAVFRLVHSNSNAVKSALKVISLIEKRGDYESLSEFRRVEYEQVKQKCKACAEQEVLLMNGLQGRSNVVDYLDHTFVDWADESGFGCDMLIRMELLNDLRSQIEDDYQFSQEEVLKIGRDICNALVLCHRKEILHRDIKPENIFYNDDGNYKLGDFGVSRMLSAAPMSKASTGVCTPEYAAPEQVSGKYDIRVDVYSLGLVLYELSNGNLLPFASSTYVTEYEVQERMLGKPLPTPKNASKAFADVILKACAHNPDDRYQTAEEFLAELNYLAGAGSRSAVKGHSSRNATQKAASSGSRNETQYARGDSTSQIGGREFVLVDPPQVPYSGKQESYSRKPKRRKSMFIAIVLLLVAGIGAVAIWGINAAADREAIAGIIDEADALCDAKNYDGAIAKIEDGMGEYPHSNELEEKLDEVVALQTEFDIATVIGEAEELASGANYEGAIAKLEVGLSMYPDSLSLQNKVTEYTDALAAEVKAQTLADAKVLADAGEYESAMSLIKAAQEAYGASKEYDEVYAAYHKAYSLGEASSLANNGDYAGAIKLLTNAQKINTNDIELIAAYNSYCDIYVTAIVESADKLMDEWNIADAIKEVEAGLKVIPGNDILSAKLSELESKKPVSLTTLKIFDEETWYWNEYSPVDMFGNTYTQGSNYVCFRDCFTESFVEYYVAGNYSAITCIAAPHEEMNDDDTVLIRIYADDKQIYSSEWVDMKTQPFTISADISGAEYIRIEVIRDDKSFGINASYGLILSDIQLRP